MNDNTPNWTMKCCLAALAMIPGLASAALVHQYTFEDGTFNDGAGSLNGTISGEAGISGGVLNLNNTGGARDGLGELDASTLALNSFTSLTLEFWAVPDSTLNDSFSGMFGAGDVNSSNSDLAANYFLVATHRGDDVSRPAISISDDADPFTEEDFVDGPELNDDALHHYVATVADVGGTETLSFYVDGSFQGSTAVGTNNAANTLASLGTAFANLGDAYPGDQNWAGAVEEFNIYDNALTQVEVSENFATGPVPEPSTGLLGGLGALVLLRRRRSS